MVSLPGTYDVSIIPQSTAVYASSYVDAARHVLEIMRDPQFANRFTFVVKSRENGTKYTIKLGSLMEMVRRDEVLQQDLQQDRAHP